MNRATIALLLALNFAAAGPPKDNPRQKSIELPGDNAMATLKAGPGVETVRANCVACHSTDYIVRQPGGDAKRWGAEVKKMMTFFGAPISEEDAKVIVQYLASSYGPSNANPPAPPPGKPAKSVSGRKSSLNH